MKHVIENSNTEEIIAIVESEEMAVYFAKFLPYKTNVRPIDYYDFCSNEIKQFLKG